MSIFLSRVMSSPTFFPQLYVLLKTFYSESNSVLLIHFEQSFKNLMKESFVKFPSQFAY